MIQSYEFGYPEYLRTRMFKEAVESSSERFYVEYHGKYRQVPVIEVRIEVPVYRMENVRTKNLQKEWMARHPDLQKDILTSDPFSIEAQEIQHQILCSLADKEGLLKAFKDGKLLQTESIICSDNGIVVNGNRRLCAWRHLYYSNKEKYKHFETIRVAVLPDHDPDAMYDLEVALQIRSDMKAEYAWHAIAADCKEKQERGMEPSTIANKQGKSVTEINTYIECYDYAAEYLDGIGHPDEWSLVDKQFFAFQKIVKGKNTLSSPGDKALFEVIAKSMLMVPTTGDRLYNQIPNVAKNLHVIAPKLCETFSIDTKEDDDDDDLDILGGHDKDDDKNAIIAAGVRKAAEPELLVETVVATLDTIGELEKEKKKKSFVLDQVKKANTSLHNAVSNLDSSMSKEGIGKQIESIHAMLDILSDWIK